MINKFKVKACFRCKRYIRIFPDNPISQKIEQLFNAKHAGHTMQIICKDELDDEYEDDEKYPFIEKLKELKKTIYNY